MSKAKDFFNIIKKLTARRLVNLLVLRISYLLSKTFKKNYHRGMPYALSIEPTTACNLGCPECPSGLKKFSRATGKLSKDLHEHIISQVHKSVFYINYYFQGEPFLNPSFLDFIRYAKTKNIYTSTSSNMHFITPKNAEEIVKSGLDRLIISIDGFSQEVYEQYRVNGRVDKVLAGTQLLIDAKKKLNSSTPHLIFQVLAVKPNEKEIPEIIALGKSMGIADIRIKTAQFYDYENGNPLMPENEDYARYKRQKDGTYKLKYKTGNHCWRMWSSCVLTWDGNIVPCCFDKDAEHPMGSITSGFDSVWNSPPYQSFRQAILTHRNQIEICKNCSEGAKVWA